MALVEDSFFITWRRPILYSKKNLRFEFVSSPFPFRGLDGNNKISISNARASVSLQSSGNLFGTQVSVSLYGLGLEYIAALSSKAMGLFGASSESVSMDIFVEDTKIFSGFMTSSIANMNMVPNAPLMITATANAELQKNTSPPFSFNGSISFSDAIGAICKTVGYSPLVRGLDGVVMTNPHYEGSIFDQLVRMCHDFDITMSVMAPTISFWPRNATKDDSVPLISAEYGLIGYPIFSNGGIMFQTQFSTLLTTGRNINIKTAVPHIDGQYKLSTVTHELSTWTEDGPWHSICLASRPID